MRPDFIFMLTRDDRTVPDARQLLPQVVNAGVKRVGFKDVGIPLSELRNLVAEMRNHGVETYMEVVSLDTSSELKSAEAALDLGVDWLLGGVRPEAVLKVIGGSRLRYCPFPGRVVGHPSVLEGPPRDIVASARDIAAMEGVHGLDLLAWRFAGDAPALVEAVCRAVDKPVIVAGSIDRADRIAAVARAGAHAFTIGTAALDAVFPARSKKLEHQIEFIHACLENAGRPDPRSSQVPA